MNMANLIHQTLPVAGGLLLTCSMSTAAADSEQVLAMAQQLAVLNPRSKKQSERR